MKYMDLNNKQADLQGGQSKSASHILNPKKLAEVQDRTYIEMLQCLMLYGECNLERPTGFGKTKIFMQLASEYPHERFLYIYDVNNVVIDIMATYNPKNVEFLSYAALSRITSRDRIVQRIVGGEFFVVIFDESHLMGGENIRTTIELFLPILRQIGCKILGGTATSIRTDGHNVTAEFFNGHTVSKYTLEDAFDDGIMLEPVTVLMLGTLQRAELLKKTNADNPYLVRRINQLEHAYADRIGAPAIYRRKITELYDGKLPPYMRFIIFYPTIKSMQDNAIKVQKDFQKAFPTYGVGLTYISSYAEHDKAVDHLDDSIVDYTIDLIASVDMLNQAYHSRYLNGIIQMRYTMSNIIYTQEYGRACSVASNQRTIVFDNVGNACVDPGAELNALFGDGTPDGRGGFFWSLKDSKRLRFHVSAEDISIEQALQRIRQTSSVTEEFRNNAKKLMGPLFNAPDDAVVKITRLPLWFVKEIRSELETESHSSVSLT